MPIDLIRYGGRDRWRNIEETVAEIAPASGDSTIQSIDGAIVFKTSRTERARINADGTGSGWATVLGGGSSSVQVANNASDWQVLTQYKIGQYVVRAGRLLLCKVDHTSSTTYGGFNSANWTDVSDAPSAEPITRITLRGEATGADSYDTTPHISIESYQRPQGGPWGEAIRFKAMAPKSKQMLSWWFATDPSASPDEVTNPLRQMVWAGAHYGAQDDADGVHGHWSVETPDSTLALRSRFAIDFLNNRQGAGSAGAVGADITSAVFANTDLSMYQGEGEIFRLVAGANERVVEFNVFSHQTGQPPGYIDATKKRWWLLADTTAESGSNAGTNFILRSFDDSGNALQTVLYATRSTGNITLGNASDQAAKMAAVWAGGGAHGFMAAPSASPNSGFSSYASKGFAAADRAVDVRVSGDANPRLKIDHNGRHDWGNGGATDISLQRLAAKVLGVGAAETFRTGVAVTGSRPSASSVGAGSQFYDSTLSKPIWSDGANWKDAAGTTV